MRNANIVYNPSRDEIYVFDTRTGAQVFMVDSETVASAVQDGELDPYGSESLEDWVYDNYEGEMHDYGLL